MGLNNDEVEATFKERGQVEKTGWVHATQLP
jgi:hypothetical protein